MGYINLNLKIYDLLKKILKQMNKTLNYPYQCKYKRENLERIYTQIFIAIIKFLNHETIEDINFLYKNFFCTILRKEQRQTYFREINHNNLYISYFICNAKEELKTLKSEIKSLTQIASYTDNLLEDKLKILHIIRNILLKLTKSFLLINLYQCNETHNCFYNYHVLFIQPPIMFFKKPFLKLLLSFFKKNTNFRQKPKIIIDLRYFKNKIWNVNDDIKFNIINTYKTLFDLADFYILNHNIKIDNKSILIGINNIERKNLEWIFHQL